LFSCSALSKLSLKAIKANNPKKLDEKQNIQLNEDNKDTGIEIGFNDGDCSGTWSADDIQECFRRHSKLQTNIYIYNIYLYI
jgi:hypothetical protein